MSTPTFVKVFWTVIGITSALSYLCAALVLTTDDATGFKMLGVLALSYGLFKFAALPDQKEPTP